MTDTRPQEAAPCELHGERLCMPTDARKRARHRLSIASDVVLRGHLEAHVATAAERGDAAEVVDELMEALRYR